MENTLLEEYNNLYLKAQNTIKQKLNDRGIEKLELEPKYQYVTNKHSDPRFTMYIKYVTPTAVIDSLGNTLRFTYLSIQQLCEIADNL